MNLSHSNSTISDHLPISEFDHTMDENRIGNKNDLSFISHDLENFPLIDDKHKDNSTFPFDQSMHPNVDEDLGIINQSLRSISFSSDFKIHKLNPFHKSELDNQLIKYPSSLSTSLNYHEKHNEHRSF